MTAAQLANAELLGAADTSWWHMEQPDNQMTITTVMVFDGRLDFEHLHYVVATRLLTYERFRQRVVEPEVPFAAPMWVRDEHFSLDHHLKRATLPPPAGRRELEALVGRLMSEPLDYERPLWQFTYVGNYQEGSVVIGRFHHCIADGIALVDLLLHLDDLPGERGQTNGAGRLQPPPAPSSNGGLLGLPWRLAAGGYQLGTSLLGVTTKLLSLGNDTATPLRGELTTEKRAAWSSGVPLEALREAAHHCGGTLNDLVACAISGSLHDFLKGRMTLRPETVLRAVVPVNLREPSDKGRLGNHFGMVWLPLPVGLEDPFDRLKALKRTMDAIKRSPEAYVVLGLLNFFGRTTRTAVHLAVQFLGRGATLVFTNVPGPREPVRMCGRRMTELMAWVPQSGRLGIGMSVISYNGQMRFGVTTDAGLVQQPADLVQSYHRSLENILDRAGAHVALSLAGD